MTKTLPQHCAWRWTGTFGSKVFWIFQEKLTWIFAHHDEVKWVLHVFWYLCWEKFHHYHSHLEETPTTNPHSLSLSLLLSVEMISHSACPDRVQPSVLMFLCTVFSHCESCGCRILDIFIKGATTNTSDWQQTNYTPTCYRPTPSFWIEYMVCNMLMWF